MEEIDAIVARAKAWQEKDRPRAHHRREGAYVGGAPGSLRVTSAYIGYLLPMMVELQHLAVGT